MIFVKKGRSDFRYEIEDVLRLFYSAEDIVIADYDPPIEFRGVFLLIEDLGAGKISEFRIVLKTNKQKLIRTILPEFTKSEKTDYQKHKSLRKDIKRVIYMLLSELTGKKLPWGVLTGVRPGKIVHEMMEGGLNKEEVMERLKSKYFVSSTKAALLYKIAEVESKVLGKSQMNAVSIYIGIPFCPTRCLYCSFTSNPISKWSHLVDKYLEALKAEILGVRKIINCNKYKIQSVYIGGGTPSSLDSKRLDDLLKYIENSLNLENMDEYTLEAGRPDSLDEEKLKVIRDSRVSRISINPQTMNNETLRLIGRNHTAIDIIEKYNLARKIGFGNINMDIIVGLPGEDLDMFKNTLKQIEKLKPESLTVHTMAVKRASRLNENRKDFDLIMPQEASKMVNMAHKFAKSMGMHPYYIYRQKNMLGNLENIGYCKPGFEGIYNVQIMEERQTIIAFGAGAITKVVYPKESRIERAFNVKNVEEYINRVDKMVERKNMLF